MTNIYKIISLVSIIIISSPILIAQKPFYGLNDKDWNKVNTPDSSELSRSVFLIGDAGNVNPNKNNSVLNLLKPELDRAKEQDVLIFLGDNVYPSPMSGKKSNKDKKKEQILLEQIKITKNFKGKTFFISGNHDWKKGSTALETEITFIQKNLGVAAFMPDKSNKAIETLNIGNDLIIIFIQSELLLNKTGEHTKKQLYKGIESIISQNSTKNIIIAQHHPIYSNGPHGGYFPLKKHIFPLTDLNKNLYIPLPVIGSVLPILRQYGISRQDLNHFRYRQMIRSLQEIIKSRNNIVVASGHEHALQLFKDGNINQVVSGSGSLINTVFNIEPALFGIAELGYAKLNYYKNGQCWVEFHILSHAKERSTVVYRKPLYGLQNGKYDISKEKNINYSDSVKLIAAGTQYASSKKRQRTFGAQYRKSWTTPVHLKYLDITREKGGLSIESANDSLLVFRDKDKTSYVFSLINRNPHNLLPKGFEATVVEDIIQDQTSTSHPYGAVVTDYLAKNIGLPYSETEIFYLPHTRLLQEHLSDFGGKVGILEKQNQTDELISTEKLYDQLDNRSDTKTDQKEYLKNRLFDLLIGDYHRDESTWLWKSDSTANGIIYKPVAKGRNQFFTKIDGYVPGFLRKLAPEIQVFGQEIKHPEKLSISARNLDRNLLNELSESEWVATADFIKLKLSNEVIIKAVKQMPKEVYDIDGIEIISKLISRKNKLTETARKYYAILAKDVKIAGTNLSDKIQIRQSLDSTSIKLTSNGDKNYQRSFANQQTYQIQLYSLAGNDTLHIEGASKNPVKIRYVGGDGRDVIQNHVKNRNILFYDNPDSEVSDSKSVRLKLNKEKWINKFDRNDFIYNKSGFSPNAMIYNATDFVSIGLLHRIQNRGFRKEPFAFDQKTGILIAPKTGALEIKYLSSFYSLFSENLDLVISGRYIGPAYDFNFYGNGNSTSNENNLQYYQVRSKNAYLNTYLQKRVSEKVTLGIGPGFAYYHILKQKEHTFLNDYGIHNPSTDWFLNLSSYLNFEYTDNSFYPKSGWRWTNSMSYSYQLNDSKFRHLNLKTDFRVYCSPMDAVPLTLAIRFGGSTNAGDYNFYQANTLSNLTNLRGYRADRFSGKTAVYSNIEGRLKVTKIRSYIIAGDLGIFGFFDTGRVFSKSPETEKWHNGYGPGVWINLFDNLIISSGYGISSEDKVFSLNIGFRF